MKENLSKKTLNLITIVLIITAFLLSLGFSSKNSIYLFLLVFGLVYWQRKRLQSFFQKSKNPKISCAIYILTGWFWAIFLELTLGRLPFNPKPIANLIIGIGFYLPYFAFWLIFIKRYQFTLLEVFYLSGLSRLIFDLLITRKLLIAASVATNALSSLLIFASQAIVTLVLFGILTTLPALYLEVQQNRKHDKPVKQYLIGLTPNFLASIVFIVWTIILKVIFT